MVPRTQQGHHVRPGWCSGGWTRSPPIGCSSPRSPSPGCSTEWTRLADGRRKRELAGIIEAVVEEDFVDRVVAVDDVAARHYADIAAGRERAGRPISMADAQTAAICRRHAAIVATRDVGDFAGTGVAVLNPWEPQPPA